MIKSGLLNEIEKIQQLKRPRYVENVLAVKETKPKPTESRVTCRSLDIKPSLAQAQKLLLLKTSNVI